MLILHIYASFDRQVRLDCAGKRTHYGDGPMTTCDWIGVMSLIVLVVCVILNMFSTGRSDKGWNIGHFFLVPLLVLSTILLTMEAKPLRLLQTQLDGLLGNPLLPEMPKHAKAVEPVPTGSAFDKTTGKLTLPAAPTGYEWVVRYQSVSTPLVAPMDKNGKIVGNLPFVVLPKDSKSVEVQIVSLDLKSVSDFVPVP